MSGWSSFLANYECSESVQVLFNVASVATPPVMVCQKLAKFFYEFHLTAVGPDS